MANGPDGEILSIVVPSYREGERLLEALDALRDVVPHADVVVAASGESAATRDAARSRGARWLDAPHPSRGDQLRRGAELARGGTLWFVHADTRLPPGAGEMIRAALAAPGVAGGAFRLRFDARHPVFEGLARMSALSWTASFLGDQAMFCRRDAYESAGGFAAVPLFEDVDLARRLARVGRLVRLGASVTTSARRFTRRGPVRQLATNAALLLAYHAGVDPARLARRYAPERPGPAAGA